MNYTIVVIIGILALGLIVYTIIKNQKDEIDFEENSNNDFPKTIDQKDEIDDDGL